MSKFRRTASSSGHPRPIVIEGLEDRRLLSASFGNPGSVIGGILSGLGIPVGGDFHMGRHQFVVGTVVSTSTTADTITISNPADSSSSPTTYTLASDATITANGSATTLASLLAGAQVELQLSTTDSTTTVTSVNAINQYVSGVISGINTTADTITITGFSGTATTYSIGSTATITLAGSTSTLGGLATGDIAQLTLSALDGMTVTNINARAAQPSRMHPGVGQHVAATVVSVDTTGDTITVSTTQNGSTTQTLYTVDPSATITADGTATTLGSLLAGAHVLLTISSTSSTTVTAIAAVSQNVSGTVSGVDTTSNTITVSVHGGTATTYTVGSGATISINGATAMLSAIATGSQANLTLSALDGKTVTKIDDRTAPPSFRSLIPINAVVVSVSTTADTITVSTTAHGTSTQTTYTVDPSATITADGATISLSSLSAGAHVVLKISSTSSTTVTSITALSLQVQGTVSSVDTTTDTITITDRAGTSTTYTLSSTAAITLNGTTSTLGALTSGTRVNLTLSALDGATVTSVTAITPGTMVHHSHAQGTVVSVDTSADTITISSDVRGSTTMTTYTLGASATITANGSTTTLGSLAAGAKVILLLTTTGTTTTVNSIAALPQHAVGVVSSVDTSADTITITPRGGTTTQTYTLGTSATVTLNGAASALGSLTAGLHVLLQLSALDGVTVLSIRANGT